MADRDSEFADRVRRTHAIDIDIQQVPEGAETVAETAEATGCEQAQIARSTALVADTLVVVTTSGTESIDTRKLATLRGVHTARTAEPSEVEATLGYEVDGVPPLCHDSTVPLYLDETLTEYETVWATAGSPDAVFPISPDQLRAAGNATVADLIE
jgi:prolyl-tRNA editing enzyme YbaK/EbsC (Cys-tRNA(Pro) deacylase)